MSIKKEIVKGTIILTAAGIVTRLIGLYNRVFLANIMSAAQLGLYQLIFPVLAVCSRHLLLWYRICAFQNDF